MKKILILILIVVCSCGGRSKIELTNIPYDGVCSAAYRDQYSLFLTIWKIKENKIVRYVYFDEVGYENIETDYNEIFWFGDNPDYIVTNMEVFLVHSGEGYFERHSIRRDPKNESLYYFNGMIQGEIVMIKMEDETKIYKGSVMSKMGD